MPRTIEAAAQKFRCAVVRMVASGRTPSQNASILRRFFRGSAHFMSRFFWVVALLLLGGCVVAASERSSDSTWVPPTGPVETPPAPPSQPPSPSPDMPPRPPPHVIVQAPPMGDREIVALYVDMLGREPS